MDTNDNDDDDDDDYDDDNDDNSITYDGIEDLSGRAFFICQIPHLFIFKGRFQ